MAAHSFSESLAGAQFFLIWTWELPSGPQELPPGPISPEEMPRRAQDPYSPFCLLGCGLGMLYSSSTGPFLEHVFLVTSSFPIQEIQLFPSLLKAKEDLRPWVSYSPTSIHTPFSSPKLGCPPMVQEGSGQSPLHPVLLCLASLLGT